MCVLQTEIGVVYRLVCKVYAGHKNEITFRQGLIMKQFPRRKAKSY